MEKDGRLHLIILGGGHVGKALCSLGSVMGYHITLMDDRESFADPNRHPGADVLVCAPYREMEERIPVYENGYYVVVTRGHQGDFICADQILRRNHTYLGIIGSRAKTEFTRKKLLEEGHSRSALDAVYMPVGLKIGGGEPEEIAVSILAQIIQVKNQKETVSYSQQVQKALDLGIPGVLLTIVEKSGSAPRGVGAAMFAADDGRIFGTIGGGILEYQAVKDAGTIQEFPVKRSYSLTQEEAGALGMVCGGKIVVQMERRGYPEVRK